MLPVQVIDIESKFWNAENMIDPWYEQNVVCPRDHLSLKPKDGHLLCANGHLYPVVDGVPVLLLEKLRQTIKTADASMRLAKYNRVTGGQIHNFYIETLGIRDKDKCALIDLIRDQTSYSVDPVVQYSMLATSGYLYERHLGQLTSYPVPEIRLPPGFGKRLIDLGCNWGRWSIAAARKGYEVVGLDPSLGAVMAARRVSHQLGLKTHFVVGDARYLPFPDADADVVFSYSVMQHFSDEDFERSVRETNRVLRPGGVCCMQTASALGIRSLYHQARRGFRRASGFEVRYRSPFALRRLFEKNIGETRTTVDCYFGLGLQAADVWMMGPVERALIHLSELLRRVSGFAVPLKYVADSLYLCAEKRW